MSKGSEITGAFARFINSDDFLDKDRFWLEENPIIYTDTVGEFMALAAKYGYTTTRLDLTAMQRLILLENDHIGFVGWIKDRDTFHMGMGPGAALPHLVAYSSEHFADENAIIAALY